MSAKIQSSPPRIPQNRQEPSAPAGQKAPAEKAQAPSPADTHAGKPTDSFDRTFAKSAQQQQEFDKKFGANSQGVLKQTSPDNCGPAAALMAAGKGGEAASKKMAELESKFTNGKGTTAEQMSQMLAHEGAAVKQAAFKYDQNTVDQSLKNGGKLVAMVDSNQINPSANKDAAGNPHWVVVDGKNSQGNYTVKDPGTGTAYDVNFDTISNAVDQGWLQHQGGGMLLVEDATRAASEAALARYNEAMTDPVPNLTPGIGSRGDLAVGRESS